MLLIARDSVCLEQPLHLGWAGFACWQICLVLFLLLLQDLFPGYPGQPSGRPWALSTLRDSLIPKNKEFLHPLCVFFPAGIKFSKLDSLINNIWNRFHWKPVIILIITSLSVRDKGRKGNKFLGLVEQDLPPWKSLCWAQELPEPRTGLWAVRGNLDLILELCLLK